MSEDEKRIFPRAAESGEQERARLERLRGQAKQNLENEEQEFNTAPAGQITICHNCLAQNPITGTFCRQCGSPLSAGQALNDDLQISVVYGPPPIIKEHPAPVYGPPAMRLPGGRKIPIFIIVIGLLLGLILIAGLLIAGLIFFPRS